MTVSLIRFRRPDGTRGVAPFTLPVRNPIAVVNDAPVAVRAL